MADSHPPLKLDSIVQVTLKEPHVDKSVTTRGIHSIKGPNRVLHTYTAETGYPKGHTFQGRLTGVLYAENGLAYFRVQDLKSREWCLDSRTAEVSPVRVPEPPNGQDGAA